MQKNKQNIHGIIVYSKSSSNRETFNRLVVNSRTKDQFADFYNKTDFIFCKKLSEIEPYRERYRYTLVILDLLAQNDSIADVLKHAETLPGYRDVSYRHFTYLRMRKVNLNLRKFLKEVPICLVADKLDISMQQVNLGLTMVAEVYGSKICHPALMKFFELYHKGDYVNAFELARIFHERYPKREILFVLFQSASLSLDYINERAIQGKEVISVFAPKNKLGLFNYKNELIAARNLFKKGKSEEGQNQFKAILQNIGGYNQKDIINVLLWILEKFITATGYAHPGEDFDALDECLNFAKSLEPGIDTSQLNFKKITMTNINKSVYNCRLGAEMAILSNVVAFYCSHIKDYEMAAKLYSAAYCFAYNDQTLQLPTLRNLMKTYKKLGDLSKVRTIEKALKTRNDKPKDTIKIKRKVG